MLGQQQTWAPRGSAAAPQGQASHPVPPEGGAGGAGSRRSTTSVDRGYVGLLDAEARSDLFDLAVLLAFVAKRCGMTPREAARSAGRVRLGELLALTEIRKMRLSTLHQLADKWGVPPSVMDDIAAAHPAAIAPESEG